MTLCGHCTSSSISLAILLSEGRLKSSVSLSKLICRSSSSGGKSKIGCRPGLFLLLAFTCFFLLTLIGFCTSLGASNITSLDADVESATAAGTAVKSISVDSDIVARSDVAAADDIVTIGEIFDFVDDGTMDDISDVICKLVTTVSVGVVAAMILDASGTALDVSGAIVFDSLLFGGRDDDVLRAAADDLLDGSGLGARERASLVFKILLAERLVSTVGGCS